MPQLTTAQLGGSTVHVRLPRCPSGGLVCGYGWAAWCAVSSSEELGETIKHSYHVSQASTLCGNPGLTLIAGASRRPTFWFS